MDLISSLELDDKDIDEVYKKFEAILNDESAKKILEKVSKGKGSENFKDVREMMQGVIGLIDPEDLNVLLEKVIKNEELVDFIQDLFLEKLI